MSRLLCVLRVHDKFPIGWGISRCRHCRVTFTEHDHRRGLTRFPQAPEVGR